jgi:putative nucleotidyltransferase with HDIG domain
MTTENSDTATSRDASEGAITRPPDGEATLGDFDDRPQAEDEMLCPACYHTHPFGAFGHRLDGADDDLATELCPRCGFQYSTPPVAAHEFEATTLVEGWPSFPLPEDEVHRRIPALATIEDERIREETLRLTRNAPPYYWVAPASQNDYHHPICRETRGLWAHTLMVHTVVERLADSYRDRGRITDTDADLARAGAILHDQLKSGERATARQSSASDHDLQMARRIRETSALPERLANAVAAHMGPWYDGPKPGNGLEDLLHNADMVASTATITPKVHAPVPEELVEIGVEGIDDA